jgi:hypothetical protein
MLKHIFLCDEMSLYFISRIGIIQKFKFDFISNEFAIYKMLKINRKLFPISLVGFVPKLSPQPSRPPLPFPLSTWNRALAGGPVASSSPRWAHLLRGGVTKLECSFPNRKSAKSQPKPCSNSDWR